MMYYKTGQIPRIERKKTKKGAAHQQGPGGKSKAHNWGFRRK